MYTYNNVKLFLLANLLRCQRDLLLWSAPLCQASVRVRDAGAGAPHLHLQSHHHPRPLKVQCTESRSILDNGSAKLNLALSLHSTALCLYSIFLEYIL